MGFGLELLVFVEIVSTEGKIVRREEHAAAGAGFDAPAVGVSHALLALENLERHVGSIHRVLEGDLECFV
ncbi:hypothetical protein D3C73_1458630 [compost metagenome]